MAWVYASVGLLVLELPRGRLPVGAGPPALVEGGITVKTLRNWGAGVLLLVAVACGGGGGSSGTDPGPCAAASDCPAGETCDNGTCRPNTPGCDPACTGATPFCDTSGGAGVCIGCRDTADCESPSICDPTTHACVGCTATEGCGGSTPICDDGRCVACTETAGCEAPRFCDLSVRGGECVTCTATAGCGEGQLCDLSVLGGRCVTCTPYAGCETGEVCDTTVEGGACVTCTASAGCTDGHVCDTSVEGGTCVVCTADGNGCSGTTDVCDTSVAGGRCVECVGNPDCAAGESCDASRCIVCNDANEGCPDARPYCDAAANDGKGECEECLTNAHCDGSLPLCQPESLACVACLTNGDCSAPTPICAADGMACVECATAGDCAANETCHRGFCLTTTSVQIEAVRAASNFATLDLPIDDALVTYVRPATPLEVAAFFVQGDRTGPAVVVRLDPATLTPAPRVGDRVSFTVVHKTDEVIETVLALTNWTVSSHDEPVAPFVQDVSAATDLVSGLDTYESEVVSLTGTISSQGIATYGFYRMQFTTDGMPSASPDLRLRVPKELGDSLGLAPGCEFKLIAGPMWRDTGFAMPSAYFASDFADVRCP
jgi:hypothetical protein